MVDTAASAAGVGSFLHGGTVDYSAITPQAEEAFHLAYPNLSIASLAEMDREQLQGVISGWKGKLFEVLVRDQLNRGDWVGDLHLTAGQHAELAHSITQPVWDLQIVDPDGHVASELQLKASESLAYAKSALEHYPDIDVVTTHDAASHATDAVSGLIDSGMSNDDLHDAVSAPLENLGDHGLLGLLDDVAPFIPFVIIITTEGRRVMMGKKTFETALEHVFERAMKTGAAMAVGAIVIWLDGGFLSIPASILTRLSIDRYRLASRVVKVVDLRLAQANAIRSQYEPYAG
ncbi:MAG: hypothetical protein WAM89_00405 [Terriglobales bacterium]